MTPQEFFSSCLAPFVLVFGFVKFMFNGIVALAYEAIKFAAPTLAKHRDIVGLFFIWKVFYFLFCDTSSDKLFLGAVGPPHLFSLRRMTLADGHVRDE